jgi:hypothetical protein
MEIKLSTHPWEPWITITNGDWCYPRNGHWFSWTWHGDRHLPIVRMIDIDDLMKKGKWK